MKPLFLGIDVGTSGVRACAIDGTERVMGAASVALPPPRQDGAAIDQEPEIWWRATVEAVQVIGRTADLTAISRASRSTAPPEP